MKLRDHPLMSYGGIANWPPVWTSTSVAEPLRGEIGILKRVMLHPFLPRRCFLMIEHEKQRYMGCLLFDDVAFSKEIHELLQLYVGCSIEEIGNIDLSHTL